MKNVMKSAIYMGKESVEIREVPIPEIDDNGVLIKNICSSICGTDVAVYMHGPNTGHKITVGQEFGHETVSRVVKVGKNVTDFKVGQRVYPYPLLARRDRSRAGTLGGFSEYIYAPDAKAGESLYFVPDEISDKTASLIEPFTVGCRAARRSAPKSGENAVVFGCGTIGIAAAIALKYFGLDKVMICDVSDFRLSIAEKLGFETCNTKLENFSDRAEKYFGTAPSLDGTAPNTDIYIDAAGADEILDLFVHGGRFGSRFVSVAVNKSLVQLDLLHLTFAQQSIIGSGGYTPEDVHDVLKIMSSKSHEIESIITAEYPLDELETAIKTASDTSRSLNVVIDFDKENN